jgi:hypothetical protein
VLAVLLIGALAALVVGAAVTVALADGGVSGADEHAERARAVAEAGLAAALDGLAWGRLGGAAAPAVEYFAARLEDEGTYTVSLTRRAAVANMPPIFDLQCEGAHGEGRATVRAQVQVCPDRLPSGLAVAGSLTCRADAVLRGCGVYVGADVHGRQFIHFSSPEDYAHPETWPAAGVHAAGHIFTDGAEEHLQPAPPPADTDACTGGGVPHSFTASPPAAALADLCAHARVIAADSMAVPLDVAIMVGQAEAGGELVVLRASRQPICLTGRRLPAPAEAQITVVVLGDARIVPGLAGGGLAIAGQLVVTGSLSIEAPTEVTGSLAVGSLQVAAPLTLELSADWRHQPPPGALRPCLVRQW